MNRVPHRVRDQPGERRVATVAGGAAVRVDQLRSDPVVERGAAQPLQHLRGVRTEQARLGAGLITDIMLATTNLAQAQLDLASAAIDARIAETQLTRALGADGHYEQAR